VCCDGTAEMRKQFPTEMHGIIERVSWEDRDIGVFADHVKGPAGLRARGNGAAGVN